MTRKTATVSDGDLYGEQTNWQSIPIDSPQWFAWLEAPDHRTFSFALHNRTKGYIDGFVTVRKESRQRGGDYWTAYRRLGDRLYKIYLGPSSSLTEAHLLEVAARLRIRDDPLPRPHILFHHPTA
jgi:hypothetical protein